MFRLNKILGTYLSFCTYDYDKDFVVKSLFTYKGLKPPGQTCFGLVTQSEEKIKQAACGFSHVTSRNRDTQNAMYSI